MDKVTNIETLKKMVMEFRNERNWKRFHDPKNLSIALSIECAELQEMFLWKTDDEVSSLLSSETERKKIDEELADIFIFLLYLSEACGVDLSHSVKKKIEINERKYPVEKSFNSHQKYTELEKE